MFLGMLKIYKLYVKKRVKFMVIGKFLFLLKVRFKYESWCGVCGQLIIFVVWVLFLFFYKVLDKYFQESVSESYLKFKRDISRQVLD